MTTTTVTSPLFEVVSRHGFKRCFVKHRYRAKIITTVSLKAGDVISKFHAGITVFLPPILRCKPVPTHITLQPEFYNTHQSQLQPQCFWHHGIGAGLFKTIRTRDELTFFIPAPKWDMSQPFVCNCQDANCLQLINGAAHLDKSTLLNTV